MPTDRQQHCDLFRAYAKAVYAVRCRAGVIWAWRFLTGEDVSDVEPTSHAQLPFSLPWAIVTAANPGSVRLSDAENMKRGIALRSELAQSQYCIHPAVNTTRDSDPMWTERALLIEGISFGSALELGQRFGQVAIIYAQRKNVCIVDVQTSQRTCMPIALTSVPEVAARCLAAS